MGDHVRAGAVEVHELGDGRKLLVGLRSGRALEGSDADAQLLLACYFYRPLEEHAADFSRRQELEGARKLASRGPRWLRSVVEQTERSVPPDPRRTAAIRQRLEQFQKAGFLVSRDGFLRDVARPADAESAPIHTVGFTTRNRPELLQRSMRSWAENAAQFGRRIEFAVIDDARTEDEERGTRQALEELAGAGLSIRLAGPAERDAYAAELAAEATVDPALVRFALRGDERCPITTGSARTSLLLDCLGAPYVLADDDGLARLAGCPEPLAGLEITSRNDPTDFWFYRNRDQLFSGVEFLERDVLGEHERLLGRSVGELIDAAGNGSAVELNGMSASFEARLRDRAVRVRTSMAGVVGDSGIGETAHLFTTPDTRLRLTVSEEFFRDAVTNRQSLRTPRRLTVSDGVITMAGNLGLDATELLPPFCPVQRNSDGLLGRTLQQCFRGAAKGYLNVAALHDPPPGRCQSLDDWWRQMQRVRFSELLGALLEAPGALDEDPREALRQVGAHLRRAASAPQPEFRGRMLARLLHREAPRLTRDRSDEASQMPAFYADLRRRQMEVMREAFADDEYLECRDLPGDRPLALAQDVIARFGELLMVWPRIWDAAARLQAAGRGLGRPVRPR